MRLPISKWSGAVLCCAISIVLLGTLFHAASTETFKIPVNERGEVIGRILSRNGDMVWIKDKKSGQLVVVNITDNTKD
jgi:hypothetical protein